MPPRPWTLYVHWPYCLRLCPFCAFNKYLLPADPAPVARALAREARSAGRAAIRAGLRPEGLRAVYFGGGTPSLAGAATVARVIDALRIGLEDGLSRSLAPGDGPGVRSPWDDLGPDEAASAPAARFADPTGRTRGVRDPARLAALLGSHAQTSASETEDIPHRPESATATPRERLERLAQRRVEVTLEANPTGLESELLAAHVAEAGVNRVSLGVQSMTAAGLEGLGRDHSVDDNLRAIAAAREALLPVAGRLSIDLIMGRADQVAGGNLDHQSQPSPSSSWAREIEACAHAAGPEAFSHLSTYQLTVERGTPLFDQVRRGEVAVPAGDPRDGGALTRDLHDATTETLQSLARHWGSDSHRQPLERYEVSSHAVRGAESVHNALYWRAGTYLAVGPGAHGRITTARGARVAVKNIAAVDPWLAAVQARGTGAAVVGVLTEREALEELVMTAIRTTHGVRLEDMQQPFTGTTTHGTSIQLDQDAQQSPRTLPDLVSRFDRDALARLADNGLIEVDSDRQIIRPTAEGMMFADGIAVELMAAIKDV
jgi:coproporphyrinogen III oxidase-like Fe-S oxidoreductase